ncbi:hypothetical protein OSB04_007516 [Centaurea solstitialis]|uniref:Integrase catalytic domain-containing protein n=1 Tax=Centaurea solstitialis TaxID=347529 RepID=A0AA38WTB2_9ASTR|nr:hypothetical protein OSB04_007516 [Centaurea solstitialis]
MSYSVIPFYTPEESLRLINGKWKLTGHNFPVWKMHLDNILRAQGKFYVLEKPVSRPKSNSPEEEFTQYFKYMADESDVMSILIFSISSEFADRLRDKSCHEVVKDIENQLGFYRHTGKLLIMKEILSLKLKKDQSVKDHLMEMRRLFKCLTRLGYKMTQEELVYLMWYSLPKEICDTASAYMKEPKTDVAALHEDILASLEPKPAPADLMDTDWIDELGDLSCPECGSKDICEHSMNIDQIEIGLPDAPGIFMIDCLITSYESWVIDTGSGNHICNHLQGFTRRKTLRKDRSNLRVGEGTPLIAEAVDLIIAMDSDDEIQYERDWDNTKRLEREKASLTTQLAKAVAQFKEKELHMKNHIKEQELQMKNQIKEKELQMKNQIKEKELDFEKQIAETKLQCKKQIKESSKIIQFLDEKLHKIGVSERTIFLNKPNALRDVYEVKWGLGYENPNLLKKAFQEKSAFYDLSSMLMSTRFPSLKGFEMKEEFSEIQEMKKHDPLYYDPKYHRVKFVYNSDTLRIKSKDSSNSSDFLVYPDINSSQESDVKAKPYVPTLVLEEKIVDLENLLKTTKSEYESLKFKETTEHNAEREMLLEQIQSLQQVVHEIELDLVNERNRFEKDREEYVQEILELQRTVADLQKVLEDKGGQEKQIVELEFAKERHMFKTEIEQLTKTVSDLQNTLTEERKVFDLKSVNLSKKISELERKIILDKKNSLKKPSLRVGKYQNMMHEFEEEIQDVHSERKVDDKKSIGLQKQIVDLQNQLSDERSQFKRKEKVLQHEKSVLEQIIAESKRKVFEEKDFENQKVLFVNEIKKLTSKLSGLSTDIMNEQRMRSDQQQKLDDLLKERNKLSAKVKELEEIVYKNNIFYFKATRVNGLYTVNLQDNNNEIYHISKRSKDIEDQTYLWHCRLGHINKKRVELLLKGGFLGTFDYKPFDNCESCLSGKMTKQPFNKENERATDLYGYVYLMRHKSESFERFREFQNEVQNQLGRKIKFLRSDRGGEYLSDEFDNHLMECGIVSQLTPPYTPQMNGVSERRNRTLLDMVRSMMCRSTLPMSFWGHALETAAHILNRAPTKSVEKTPYELWKGKKPNISFLRIWGCEVYVKRPTSEKLKPKSDKCFFVGYPKTTVGYYFYNPEENKVFVARNGKFLEEKFLSTGNTRKGCRSTEPIEEVQTQDLRRSSRVRQEPDSHEGRDAIMYENQVWELTGLPQHCRAVGRKWVFKKKTDMDGNVHTFKARLVAKGFTQTHGIDYDETFSPVAMLKSIRILMAISAYFDYEFWQMDVKTAFLNGKLTKDVYMEQPEGFQDPKNPIKVWKLLNSIYGLKQASRSWNLHFDERIKEFSFAKSEFEPCVYTKFSESIVTFLVLYVDDILLIGNDVPTLQSVKNWLSKCFQMKDLGEPAYILGIKIYRNRSKRLIGLSQSTYIDKILKKFRMDESKKGFIPMQHGIVLSITQCPVSSQDQDKMKSVPYASAIGSIMYAMLCTRPDVAYSVSVTSRYQQNPGEPQWVAVKNILKYMRRTKDMFLVFGGYEDEISVTGYSDASSRPTETILDHSQDSTTEAEYIAASDAAKEAVWLRNFLSDLRVVASVSRPIDIFCDNSGAVAQAKEPREHHKSRHVLRKYHLIREIIGRGDVRICKIPTEENVADPLTKPLARVKHEAHANSIGMQYLDTMTSFKSASWSPSHKHRLDDRLSLDLRYLVWNTRTTVLLAHSNSAP